MSKISLSPNCLNCQHPVPKEELYCGNCGQKHHDGKYSVGEVISEFIETNFNLDAKIFRTIWGLFQPGFLTKEYFRGAHKTYYKPIRLFLVIGIIAFAIMQPDFGESSDFIKDLEERRANLILENEWDTLRNSILAISDDEMLHGKLDSFRLSSSSTKGEFNLEEKMEEDSLPSKNKGFHVQFGGNYQMVNNVYDSTTLGAYTFSSFELLDYSPQEIIDRHFQDEPWYEKMIFRQLIKSLTDGKGMIGSLISRLPIILLLLTPLYALIYFLLYLRRKKFFVEHFVFILHLNAFSLLLALITYLLQTNLGLPDWIAGIVVLIYLTYFYIALRKYYKQGWLKTFVKFTLINFLGIFAGAIGLTVVLLIGMLLY